MGAVGIPLEVFVNVQCPIAELVVDVGEGRWFILWRGSIVKGIIQGDRIDAVKGIARVVTAVGVGFSRGGGKRGFLGGGNYPVVRKVLGDECRRGFGFISGAFLSSWNLLSKLD